MNTKTVLVVDDEIHVTHVVSMKLRNAGLRVLTASDGEEALHVVRSERIDLLVTDFQMPVLSGFDLCLRLRADAATADIPVVMVTARGHMISDAELARTNIKEVVCKPFSPRLMLDRVLRHLGLASEPADRQRTAA